MTKISMAKQPTVLITGCSEGGIGHSLAIAFANQNYRVFATARRLSNMMSLSEFSNITLLELDITSSTSVQSVYETVSAATGGTLDILYHNAGFRNIVMGIHSTWELAEKTFHTNVFGVVEMNRVFMPLLFKAGKGSKIVISNSVAAVIPIRTTAIYNASKAALDMYARVLDLELRPLGIYVVNIMTGQVATKMAETQVDEFPKGSPYQQIRSTIVAAWKGRVDIMPATEYSSQVVKVVSKPSPPSRIWLGTTSNLAWALNALGVQWVYAMMTEKEFGFDQLKVL